MFHDSQASASRRSSVHEVADHTSADTPQSVASSSWARSASRTVTPEARICPRGVAASSVASLDGAYRYSPRKMPCSRAAWPPGNEAGSGGCGYGSLYTVR